MDEKLLKELERTRIEQLKKKNEKVQFLEEHIHDIKFFSNFYTQKELLEAFKKAYNIKMSPSFFAKFLKTHNIHFPKSKKKYSQPTTTANQSTVSQQNQSTVSQH